MNKPDAQDYAQRYLERMKYYWNKPLWELLEEYHVDMMAWYESQKGEADAG